MSGGSGYRPIVWLRRILLIVLVAFLGVVTGLLFKGGRGGSGEPEIPEEVVQLRSGEEGQLRTGKGFGHEVSEGGETRYRIAATSWSATRDETVSLEGVHVTVQREGENNYQIDADRGLYQESTSTARLEGNVVIRSSEGVELKGPGFELTRRGRQIVSIEGPVDFRYQDRFAGRANRLIANLNRERSELTGSVTIWSLAGAALDASLEARKLIFEERKGQIHAEGGVTLRRDEQQLEAQRLSVTLDDGGKEPRFVRAKWEVRGSSTQVAEGVPRTVQFSADELSLFLDPVSGDPEKAELEGGEEGPVELRIVDAGGLTQQLSAPYLVAEFTAGDLSRADIVGPVDLRDFLALEPETPLLVGCAAAAEARFRRNGELSALVLDGRVELNQPDAQISGSRLETKGRNQIAVTGEPARIHARRGEFEAPEILYRTEERSGRASGGVRATLTGDSELGLMARTSERDEPIRVTAELADWSEETGEVLFKQKVRAWQAENFLVANEVTLGPGGNKLTAQGQVKTVIKKARREDSGQPARESGEETGDLNEDGGESPPQPPVEVTANRLEYGGETDTLRYTGTPKAYQAGRTLSCNDLEVTLDESSEVESMTCKGNALIENSQAGQTIRGSEAVYRPGDESVLVTGNPVVLRRADGTQLSGGRVVYDLKAATARILSDPPVVSEEATESQPEGET